VGARGKKKEKSRVSKPFTERYAEDEDDSTQYMPARLLTLSTRRQSFPPLVTLTGITSVN